MELYDQHCVTKEKSNPPEYYDYGFSEKDMLWISKFYSACFMDFKREI